MPVRVSLRAELNSRLNTRGTQGPRGNDFSTSFCIGFLFFALKENYKFFLCVENLLQGYFWVFAEVCSWILCVTVLV